MRNRLTAPKWWLGGWEIGSAEIALVEPFSHSSVVGVRLDLCVSEGVGAGKIRARSGSETSRLERARGELPMLDDKSVKGLTAFCEVKVKEG